MGGLFSNLVKADANIDANVHHGAVQADANILTGAIQGYAAVQSGAVQAGFQKGAVQGKPQVCSIARFPADYQICTFFPKKNQY